MAGKIQGVACFWNYLLFHFPRLPFSFLKKKGWNFKGFGSSSFTEILGVTSMSSFLLALIIGWVCGRYWDQIVQFVKEKKHNIPTRTDNDS